MWKILNMTVRYISLLLLIVCSSCSMFDEPLYSEEVFENQHIRMKTGIQRSKESSDATISMEFIFPEGYPKTDEKALNNIELKLSMLEDNRTGTSSIVEKEYIAFVDTSFFKGDSLRKFTFHTSLKGYYRLKYEVNLFVIEPKKVYTKDTVCMQYRLNKPYVEGEFGIKL